LPAMAYLKSPPPASRTATGACAAPIPIPTRYSIYCRSKLACDAVVLRSVPLCRAGHFPFGESNQSHCSWFGSDFVRVPSLRRRSVGPRRTDIHVLTALSRHPCRLAHSSSPAFGLHPSRVLRCVDYCALTSAGWLALTRIAFWLNFVVPQAPAARTQFICRSALARDGVFEIATAGKPCCYRCVCCPQSPPDTRFTVGASLLAMRWC
jgi:hypothetical protein